MHGALSASVAQTLLQLGETLLIGTIGGAVFTYAGIPAGWLSGR